MTLYGAMMTSVSGMNAQVSRLGTVGDNISNAGTIGYKRADTSFASMVAAQGKSGYNSGGVTAKIRYSISMQGNVSFSTQVSDLAIQGTGFFIVRDPAGVETLSRAGNFQYDSEGNLTSGGYGLMGEKINAPGVREPIQVDFGRIDAAPSSNAKVTGNLDVRATTITTTTVPGPPVSYTNPTPALNQSNSIYTSKSSLIAINGTGGAEILDIYYTKTPANIWEVAVFKQADAATTTTGFPYNNAPLATGQLEFDPVNGQPLAPLVLNIAVPNGQMMTLDLSETTQLAYEFSISEGIVDGRRASSIEKFAFAADGTISAVYSNGHIEATHRLVLASVTSPDKLTVLDGTRFQANMNSGPIAYGYPNEEFYGRLMSGALEGSNVDIADELTNMIETQRIYTANSKAFQTGADMFETLTSLKR